MYIYYYNYRRSLNLPLLPTQITHLSHLTLLDLSYNQLTTLPSTLNQLKQLRHLNLAYNQLDHLPFVISQLPKLTILNISHNTQLTHLPRSLAQVHRLVHLDISYTNIASLPVELSTIMTIRYDHCDRLLHHMDGFEDQLVHNPPSLMELCVRHILALPNYSTILKLRLEQQNREEEEEEQGRESEEKNEKEIIPIHKHQLKKKKKNVLKQKLKNIWQLGKEKMKPTLYSHSTPSSSTSTLLELPDHVWDYMMNSQPCSFCGKLFVKDYILRYRIIQRLDESLLPIYYHLCCAHWSNESDRLLLQFSTPS